MIYPAVTQTPVIEADFVVAWILRLRAQDNTFFGDIEERVDLPVDQHKPVADWSVKDLETLLNRISNERNMVYRATKIVMDAKEQSGQ